MWPGTLARHDYALDHGLQGIWLCRLHEVIVEAGGHSPTSIRLEAPAGERDQMRVLSPRPRLNLACGLIAIKQWHANIEEYELRLKAVAGRERFYAVVHRADLVTVESQQHRKRVRCITIVIGHQNAQPLYC
jgi:hypothetical protein